MRIEDPQQALLATALMNVALVVLTAGMFWAGVFVARRLGRPSGYSLAPLGLALPRGGVLAAVGLGFLVGLGAVLVGAVVRALTIRIFDSLGYSTESNVQQPFMQGLAGWVRQSPETAIPAMVAVVVVLGPAAEELVFRGVIFNGLNRLGRLLLSTVSATSIGKAARVLSFSLAAVLSSGLFALLHLEPTLLPALVLLAVVLCALFELSGSLLPSFAAHATFNSFTVLLLILSGLDILPVPT